MGSLSSDLSTPGAELHPYEDKGPIISAYFNNNCESLRTQINTQKNISRFEGT